MTLPIKNAFCPLQGKYLESLLEFQHRNWKLYSILFHVFVHNLFSVLTGSNEFIINIAGNYGDYFEIIYSIDNN